MLNCLVLEDEPLAAGILEEFIRQVPFLQLAGKSMDALDALEVLREVAVDVLFLDIHLPGMKGLDLLKSLSNPPQVILTTAYHEYALEGYELGVVDYLLKPISFDRFLKAVQKLKANPVSVSSQRKFRFFNVNKKMVRVWLDEILFVESLKEYVRIFLKDGDSVITKMQIGEMELLLDANEFIRIHRSFLVSLDHISTYSPTEISIGSQLIPIGRQYKESVMGMLNKT